MEFTHFDEEGNARMVDVSGKEETKREAVARGFISMNRECLNLVKAGSMAKGDVLGAARIAGIMGAKRTSELIPLCHPLMLTHASIDFDILEADCAVRARCTVKLSGKTDHLLVRDLGLPIVNSIITSHGGHIELDNAPEGGAVVRLSLPAAEGEVPAPEEREASPETGGDQDS